MMIKMQIICKNLCNFAAKVSTEVISRVDKLKENRLNL